MEANLPRIGREVCIYSIFRRHVSGLISAFFLDPFLGLDGPGILGCDLGILHAM